MVKKEVMSTVKKRKPPKILLNRLFFCSLRRYLSFNLRSKLCFFPARKIIDYCFTALFFVTPLLVLPYSHELFEFPKMMFVYLLTGIIVLSYGLYGLKESKEEGKEKFVRNFPIKTLAPFGIFLGVNIISSINSVNKYTSIFGYYTRFNGGLISLICYGILFFVFIRTQFQKEENTLSPSNVYRYINTLIVSTFCVSIYGTAQHFGIDATYWVQNSRARVFSTLGQPNWLAAYLAILIPITIAQMFAEKESKRKKVYLFANIFLLISFWFTYSLSGLLGLTLGLLILFLLIRKEKIDLKYLYILIVSFILVVVLFPGIFFTRIKDTIKGISEKAIVTVYAAEENLEAGPGNTANIRLLIWENTFRLIKSRPFFGSGPETFAYAFLPYRPKELNLTTEWSFLYNKAHNEYLNVTACTGIIGLFSYLYLIFWLGKIQLNRFLKEKDNKNKLIEAGIFSGWVTILITNFFGFSVVNTNILLFLLPALIFSFGEIAKLKTSFAKTCVLYLAGTALIIFPILITTADVFYAKGEGKEGEKNYKMANELFRTAVKINPFEPAYSRELAFSLAKNGEFEEADVFAQKAFALNPYNSLSLKSITRSYFVMAESEKEFYKKAETVAMYTAKYIPTDPQASYNLAVTYYSEGKLDEAKKEIERTLSLKPDYPEAQKLLESL